MKQLFILFGSAYLLLLTAPLWVCLLIWKKKDVKITDEFTEFYDSAFRGVFDPIAKLFKVPKDEPPKMPKLKAIATQDIKEGDYCSVDIQRQSVCKLELKK